MTAAAAILQTVTVTLTWPTDGYGGVVETINATDPSAVRAGQPSLLEALDVAWKTPGPLGQPDPTETRLSILSTTARQYPTGCKVIVTATWAGAAAVEVVYGWTEQDTVTISHVAGDTTYWRHDLIVTDPVQWAAGVYTTSRPAESCTSRYAALQGVWPFLPAMPAADVDNAIVDALDYTDSLLDALQEVARATGQQVGNYGSTAGFLALKPHLSGTGRRGWWMSTTPHYLPGQLVTLTPDQVEHVPSTLDRACGADEVMIGYETTAGVAQLAGVYYTPGGGIIIPPSLPPRLRTRLTIDSGIIADTAAGPALVWWQYLADAITKAEPALPSKPAEAVVTGQPSLDTCAVTTDQPDILRILTGLPTRTRGAVLEIAPTPAGVARFHVVTSGQLTINADLTWDLLINPTPAGLYGLRVPCYITDLQITTTFVAAYAAGGGPALTYNDLRCTLPRLY
jgi:hypothetical protein